MPPWRVEFVGPMGAGKSTLAVALRCALRRTPLADSVAYAGDEVSAISRQHRINSAAAKGMLYRLIVETVIRIPRIRQAIVPHRPRLRSDRIESYYKESGDFLSHMVRAMAGADGPSAARLLFRASLLNDEIAQLLFLSEYSHKSIVFHDESLLHRGLHLVLGNSDGESHYRRYCETVPAPGLVFYVTAEPTSLRRRLSAREGAKFFLAHVDEVCRLSQLAVDVLGARGVPILHLDGNSDKHKNVGLCVEAIQALAAKSRR